MQESCQSILQSLLACQAKFNKSYSFPSQFKLLQLLELQYGIKRSRRWLNYQLRKLEDSGYIRRVRRIKRNSIGTLTFQSTLYFLQKKAYLAFSKLARLLHKAKIRIKNRFQHTKKAMTPDERAIAFNLMARQFDRAP